MKDQIIQEITAFVLNDPRNRFEFLGGGRAFDAPIVRVSAADDPLFSAYKTIIDPRHMTPKEAFEAAFGAGSFGGGSVVSIVLPYSEAVRKSQRGQTDWPSKEWTLCRTFADENFRKTALRDFVTEMMKRKGFRAVIPAQMPGFAVFPSNGRLVSAWSERHVAYAAGLGTFSLNDAFITEKGICVKLLSFVTDCALPPDARTAKDYRANCLYYAKGTCGACIKRCPAGAITLDGHDVRRCHALTYGERSKQIAEDLGALRDNGSGCALCQCGVPCEYRNPVAKEA
ncbi:(Fe-S)-binding protein [Clostridia bacterium]|nr:(Fe-S)-binding protein [Clostridia bacterium]